jgi:uncharacterized protein YneF (UPF0154 family)
VAEVVKIPVAKGRNTMKDSLAKYALPAAALFVAGLNVYLNLENWREHGTNLMPVALNIVVTFAMLALMLASIMTFWSARKKLVEKLKQPPLTEAVIEQIKQAGRLESLAGRADYLAQFLEEVWHDFLREKKNMPNPIGVRSMPDVIEQWTDKQLLRFRVHYQSYLGSMKATDPQCDSDLMKDDFPHEFEDYLSVKRKIEDHAKVMRKRTNELLSGAKAACDGSGNPT